jgi:hypothetical protein
MQKNKLFLLCFLLISVFACKNNADATSEIVHSNTNTEISPAVFPVTEFINGQLHDLEKMPITPLQIITSDGGIDSFWMKRENIRGFARPFLSPLVDSITMQPYYNSKSFFDQTINAITFIYDANNKLPKNIALTHFDVYINPESGKVNRIYLVKQPSADSTIQLTWTTDKWFSITTIVQMAGKKPTIQKEKMIWQFD